jgi:hypothetical protein
MEMRANNTAYKDSSNIQHQTLDTEASYKAQHQGTLPKEWSNLDSHRKKDNKL